MGGKEGGGGKLKEEEEGEVGRKRVRREALPMLTAHSGDGEQRSSVAVRSPAFRGHTAWEDDDDHERQAAFLHAPGSSRA